MNNATPERIFTKARDELTGPCAHPGLDNPAYDLAGCFVEGSACPRGIQAERQANIGFWRRPYRAASGNFHVASPPRMTT